MSPDVVLTLLRSTAYRRDVTPEQALLDLIGLLARTHETMDSYDWEVIATAGAAMGRDRGKIRRRRWSEVLTRRLRNANTGE